MVCQVSLRTEFWRGILIRDPDYYHQTPPKVPHFFRTLLRRKLVLWFLASEVLRDYWLSGVCQQLLPIYLP
jgi:hypothetical protein